MTGEHVCPPLTERRGNRRIDADIARSLPHPLTKAAPGLSAISSSFKSKPPLPLEASEMGLFRLSLEAVERRGPQ